MDYERSSPIIRFDVWLLRVGRSQFSATPEDVVMVGVAAENALGARSAGDVQHVVRSGFFVLDVVAAGTPSVMVMEIKERARRALDNSDRPEGYRDANSTRPYWR